MPVAHVVGMQTQESNKDCNDQNHENNLELPLFDLATVMKATNNFSLENKLGEGGFGPVYKVTSYTKQRNFLNFFLPLKEQKCRMESKITVFP